jgi:nitrogen fixation/metabolism regulation signal transduction histidine kinase
MIYRRFTIRIVLIVMIIAITGMCVVWSFFKEDLVIARFTFSALWVLSIGYLIYYVNGTNRALKAFLESLRYLDSVRVHKGKGRSFEELDRLYNEITGIIRKVEIERETDRQYFRYLVDHVGVGLLAFNETGEVEIMNEAAEKLLKMNSMKRISDLEKLSPALPALISAMKPGYQKLLKLTIGNEVVRITIKAAEFRLQSRKVRVVSIQNIKNELEEEELEAWQKLIRVLTHEIMNSITPVNSLTNTIIRLFEANGQPKKPEDLDATILGNALEGLHSIEKRNKGLIGFVQSYRSLTRIQKPAFTLFSVGSLMQRISQLARHEVENAGIRLSLMVKGDDLVMMADEKLVEQILINLINNAAYALSGTAEPDIRLMAGKDHGAVLIEVQDNGCGIPDEIISNIFVPFFTTKEDGSGIGLSLSRQIMRLHGGSISVQSKPGDTVFSLRFPQEE